jgi:hypothetical protein
MSNARFIVMLLLALTLAAFAAQLAIDFSTINIAAACFVLASAVAVLLYINWTPSIQTHPLSTFALLGFCFTTQLGALLVQSATWTPLALNLRQPVETFATLAGFQGIALVAHAAYRLFAGAALPGKSGLLRATLEKLGLYAIPTAGTLWFMGVIGLFSLLLGGSGAGVASKVFQGMSIFAWAPFLIPMFVLQQGPGYCNMRRNFFFLALYAALIVLFGMAVNARGLMLSGFMTIALFALLRAMRSLQQVRAAQVARLGVLAVVLGALSIPVGDLVTAMVIARKSRGNLSAVKMVEESIYYFQRPYLLEAQRQKDNFISVQSSYDETYFASPLIGRLIETKFHDNALYFSTRIPLQDDDKLLQVTIDSLWTTLPEPLLQAMKIDVQKKNLRFSIGDYISYLGGGGEVGGFKQGSAIAQGIVLFGYFFPLIYLLMCPILFMALDILAYRSVPSGVLVSSLGMLGIWRTFLYGISTDSLQNLFMAVVRSVPQNIILYLLIFHIARIGARMLGSLAGMSRPAAALAS